MLLHFLLQSENVLEVAKRAKRSLADSFNTMVRRKVIMMIMILMTMMMIMMAENFNTMVLRMVTMLLITPASRYIFGPFGKS